MCVIQAAAESVAAAKNALLAAMQERFPMGSRVHVKTDKRSDYGKVCGYSVDTACIQIISESTDKKSSVNYKFVTFIPYIN